MDSKNIFIAASHMKSKMDWAKHKNNEWSYVGDNENYQTEQVQNFINQYFDERELYIAITRQNSYSVSKDQASIEIINSASKQEVIICNLEFTKMIEFNRIGVARHGEYS